MGKKKYNPLGSDGKISLIIIVQFIGVLQTYCGWMSRQLGKHSEKANHLAKLRIQRTEDILKGAENKSREPLELGEVCGVPVDSKQLAEEVTQLWIEIRKIDETEKKGDKR